MATFKCESVALFAKPRPVEPVALFGGKVGVFGLGDSTGENIENAGILTLPGQFAELVIQPLSVFLFELCDGLDAEEFEVPHGGWTDRAKVF